jgi:hypothetical protein
MAQTAACFKQKLSKRVASIASSGAASSAFPPTEMRTLQLAAGGKLGLIEHAAYGTLAKTRLAPDQRLQKF